MKSKKVIRLGLIGILSAATLSACTPPMPPEFKAELSERYVTCVAGQVTVSAPSELQDVAQIWIDGLTESCPDFSGTLLDLSLDPTAKPDVYLLGAGTNATCTVAASAPVGIDAVAVSVTVEGLDGVVFSPALLHRALSGGMTSWADPELQDLNPDLELTDTPVVLRSLARPQDISALNDWMSRIDPVGWPSAPAILTADNAFDAELVATELEVDGTLSIVPASFATNYSISSAAIQTAEGEESVPMNIDTIISAGTQMTSQTSGSIVTATLDPMLAPVPEPGVDVAQPPWQALNQFSISVCSGANEIVGRAFARYSLRLDSQGVLTTAGYTELPEGIRTAGVDAVSIGLPDPTILPTDAPADVVPTDMPTDDPTDMPTEEPAVDATDAATPEPTS